MTALELLFAVDRLSLFVLGFALGLIGAGLIGMGLRRRDRRAEKRRAAAWDADVKTALEPVSAFTPGVAKVGGR
ncbi:hypothetical protein [Paractinoplanes toevensis]|uniref:Uncharacterized protein n=1 Tax=Paractinoplanes toevensis TaxID=571911 RepID=A0A919W7T9_9ACTN|nr:hypothetical protein [Actinoplanes toevensis]GIM90351.1 hypothetical protein Ato02nite_021440 [Actinoplanes toevensis]